MKTTRQEILEAIRKAVREHLDEQSQEFSRTEMLALLDLRSLLYKGDNEQ
jgi:hypothetical protein